MTVPSLTLAGTMEALSRHPDLSARTKADLQSAVRCFCRVLSLDPAVTDAGDLAALQDRLATAAPERSGLSRARWSVVRSQVLRALELTGAASPLRTAAIPLSPNWEAFLAAIPQQGQRLALSRFARFCSQQQVGPDAVSQMTFDRFGETLTAASLVRNPVDIWRDAARAWMALPAGILASAPAQVTVPPQARVQKPGRYPLAAFPQSFQDDLAAFRRWCVTADPLDEQARPKPLRGQTVISYTSFLHTAADAAVRSGVPIEEVTSLTVLTDRDIYLRILRQLLADTEQKATANVHGVAGLVPIVARDWLRQSPEQIIELKRLQAKLPKLRPGLTPKNRDMLAAFDDKALLGRFLRLGDDLWKEALSDRLPKNQRLVRAQMALLIDILQITPLRRKNICALVFDEHITWPNGPRSEALIQVAAADTKTEVDYLGELPLELSRRIHHYRTKLAPAITGKVPTHLFVKSDGTPKKPESVVDRLVVTLGNRLGIHMTAHQFRHFAGKLMLDANPGAYETVAQMLGHTGTKNVVRFYGGTDTRRASRHHGALIEKLREENKKRGTRGRKT